MGALQNIRESIRTFSFLSAFRSNIMSGGYGYSRISPNTLGMTGGRYGVLGGVDVNDYTLSAFYDKINEIHDYECSQLSSTILSILKDYLVGYLNNSDDIISLMGDTDDDRKYEKKINSIFKYLNIVSEIQVHIMEIIYYGSYSYKLNFDKEDRKYILRSLVDPYSVVDIDLNGEKFKLVQSNEDRIYRMPSKEILTIGYPDVELENDAYEDEDIKKLMDEIKNESEFHDIYKVVKVTASQPLYFNLCTEVKEYLLKQKVVAILSMKDLIQPLLLLYSVDKGTSPDIANDLALNAENLINKYADISMIVTSNFSINDILDNLMNNIRVLPDYNQGLGSMNSVDLSKISDKISEIRGEQDNAKEDILRSIGIPMDLFDGGVTRWEALKSSERLVNKVNSIMNSIDLSIADATCKFYLLLTGKELPLDQVKVNIFNNTELDYNRSTISAEIASALIDSITSILSSAQSFIEENKLIDKNEYVKYIRSKLVGIDSSLNDIITDKVIEEFIKSLISEESEESSEGSGDGEWGSSSEGSGDSEWDFSDKDEKQGALRTVEITPTRDLAGYTSEVLKEKGSVQNLYRMPSTAEEIINNNI